MWWIQIGVLLLESSEPALNNRITSSPAFPVHADSYAQIAQAVYPISTGVLSSLTGIADLRLTIDSDSFPQQRSLILFLQAIGKLPTNDKSAVKVNNCRQKHGSALHYNVGNIDCPDLIRTGNTYPAQQVGMNVICVTQPGKVSLRIDRLYTHLSKQPANSFHRFGLF